MKEMSCTGRVRKRRFICKDRGGKGAVQAK